MKCDTRQTIQKRSTGNNSCESTSCIANPVGLLLEHNMKKIRLANNKGVVMVDDEDYECLMQWKWHYRRGNSGNGYAGRSLEVGSIKRLMSMHRLIMSAPEEMQIDHINHNGLDNRKQNLRICTRSQNQANRRPEIGHSSKYKGVCWRQKRKKWNAHVVKDHKQTYLGSFDDEVEAAKAYDKAAYQLFGEFAWLNFPRVILENRILSCPPLPPV